MKKYLGSPVDVDVDRLKLDYEKLKDENIKLKRQVEELKKEVTDNLNGSLPHTSRTDDDTFTPHNYIIPKFSNKQNIRHYPSVSLFIFL